ncbi:MAG: sulfur oxidation c-type cytochrome SoxA [Betaproteobacteria bacterium]|nr:sulfur oxidation c-type cytochrome SoxA [Betaproteobacteria bacterium]
MIRLACVALALALCIPALSASEDGHIASELQKYRKMLQDGNPADLMEMRGEELWTMPRGAKNATLEQCDLGLGAGKLEGAYARLPRYFADTDRVQDAESRLAHCMATLQGLSEQQATRNWYKPNSDMEALVTYVAAQSKGKPIAIPLVHGKEKEMVGVGEEIFFRRAGPLDFSCATCHSQPGRRIRLQELPNFGDNKSAQSSMITWPAYRVSQSAVWTMERRLIDCLRQMRYPDADYLSDAVIALQSYLQQQARGGVMEAPGIKR